MILLCLASSTTPRRRKLLVALAQYTVTHFRSSSTRPSSWFLSSLFSPLVQPDNHVVQKFDTRKTYNLSNEVIFFAPFFVRCSLFGFKLGATAVLCLRNRPIANMATISPKRGFSVATVARVWLPVFTCAVAGKTAVSQVSFPLNSTKTSHISSLKEILIWYVRVEYCFFMLN